MYVHTLHMYIHIIYVYIYIHYTLYIHIFPKKEAYEFYSKICQLLQKYLSRERENFSET